MCEYAETATYLSPSREGKGYEGSQEMEGCGEKQRMCGFQVAVVVLENLDSKSDPAIESLRRKALPVDRVVVNQTWGKKAAKGTG
jgi:hypothetical protein